jgi:simple sugar transport system permease protein
MVLVFGSLSGVMCERSGVVNIAIEGQFIAGAFLGSMIASTTGNFFYAAIAGAFVGGLIGLVLAFFALRYQSDQIIVGIVLVTMLSSLSSYLNLQVFTPFPNFNTGNLAPNLAIPLLSKIPIIGPVLFNQSAFFYLMIVLVAACTYVRWVNTRAPRPRWASTWCACATSTSSWAGRSPESAGSPSWPRRASSKSATPRDSVTSPWRP